MASEPQPNTGLPDTMNSNTTAGLVSDNAELADHSWLDPEQIPIVDSAELHDKCLQVVELIESLDLSLGHVVWAINFGNTASRQCNKMQEARKSFMRDKYLIPTLHNIRIPPRRNSKGKRPPSARDALDRFSLSTMCVAFRSELQSYGKLPGANINAFAQTDRLSAMTYDQMEHDVRETCPTLFKLMHVLSTSVRRRGKWCVNMRDSVFFVVMQIAGISYETSQLNNNFQKLLSIYFYSHHVPKAVVELLHRCNVCMSYSWTLKNMGKLAVQVRRAMVDAALKHPIMLSHDNIRLRFPIRSQRGNSQTVTDNGTAMTMFVLPDSARAAFENPESFRALRSRLDSLNALGMAPAVTWSDLSDPIRRSRVFRHRLFYLFDILRSIPGLESVEILAGSLLQRPDSWHTLPHGAEHRTKQYMLATKPIDESTYAGNLQVIDETLRQLGLDRNDPLVKLTLERVLAWIGDDMTVHRCRGVKWIRGQERNGRDRLDPFIFIFGWFHAQLCLVSSIFECGRGSAAGVGFMRSVLKLTRTGFTENMRKKRPDYHTVVEFLMHEFEARVRGFWMWATGTSSVEELVAWVKHPERSAQEIFDLGRRIQSERISSQAVSAYRQQLSEHDDEVFLGTLVTTRDLMIHWDLRHAVKQGQVGHMEDVIPELLIYFTGGQNKNYARQMYEILQLLYHETTPEIREAIRSHCFLVNMLGRSDSFYPIDMRQEHNNGGIRKHAPPPQGGTSWEEYSTISSVIPTMMDVVQHVEDSVTGIKRSRIHKDPPWEKEVCRLVDDHTSSQLLTPVEGRKYASKKDQVKDYIHSGSLALQDKDGLRKYAQQRNIYLRARSAKQELDHFISPPAQPPAPPSLDSPAQSPLFTPLSTPEAFPGSPEAPSSPESILTEE